MNKKINILALLLLSANPILIQARLTKTQVLEVAGISAVGGITIAGLLRIAYKVWNERSITKAELKKALKREANEAKLRATKESGTAADALERSSYNLQELANGITNPLEGKVDGLDEFLEEIKVKGVLSKPVEQTLNAYAEDPAANGPEIINTLKENPEIKSEGLSEVVGELYSIPKEPTIDPKAIEAAKEEFKASVDEFNDLSDTEKATVFEKLSDGDTYTDVIKLGDSGEYLRFVTNGQGQSSYEISEEPPATDETVSDITPDEFADALLTA